MSHFKKIFWIPLLLAFLCIVFTSSFSISGFSFYDEKRIVQAFVLLISSLFFLVLIFYNELIGFRKIVKICFFVLLLLAIISAFMANLPRWALLQVGWYVLLFNLLLLTSNLFLDNRQLYIKVLVLGLISLCVLYSSRVFADYIIGSINENWTTWPNQRRYTIIYEGVNLFPSGFLGFSNQRFFNHLQTWSLPLLVFGYLYYKDKLIPGLRYLLLFFISTWWMLVFASDARGTMLASLISLVFIVFLFRAKSFNFAKVYGLTAVMGLILYAVLFLVPSGSEGKEIFTRFHDSGRFEVWQLAAERIIENPWLGLGPMHINYAEFNPLFKAPHNILLQYASEWGIPATLIALSICLWAFYWFIKQSRDLYRRIENSEVINLRIALVASISAALIHSLFSGIYNTPLSQLLGAIIIGAILGEYFKTSGKVLFKKRETKSLSIYILIIILFANTAFVGIKVISDIPKQEMRKKEFLENFDAKGYYPRFWNQGVIYKRDNEIRQEGKKKDGQDLYDL